MSKLKKIAAGFLIGGIISFGVADAYKTNTGDGKIADPIKIISLVASIAGLCLIGDKREDEKQQG